MDADALSEPVPAPPYPPSRPPAVLWHAVTTDRAVKVSEEGLVPTGRPHVHLARSPAIARRAVGVDREVVLFEVDAGGLDGAGARFYCSPKGSWLVARVPPAFLRVAGEDAPEG